MTTIQRFLIDLVRGGLRRHKWTQKQLAQKAQVSEQHLSQMLTGKVEGTLSTWQKLIDVLHS